MRKAEVQIDKVYVVKVSGVLVPVRLDRESPFGGYDGTNLKTGRVVRVRSAARLRYEARAAQPAPRAGRLDSEEG